jgi:hypothetical protein
MKGIPGFTVKDDRGHLVAPDPGQKHAGRRRFNEDGTIDSSPPPPVQPFLVRIPKGLHYALKRKCHKERESMNTIIVELCRQWVLGKVDLELDIKRELTAARERRAQS